MDTNVKPIKRTTHVVVPLMERAAMSVREFAGLFGNREAWGHQRARSGEVDTIRINGQRMVTPVAVQGYIDRHQAA